MSRVWRSSHKAPSGNSSRLSGTTGKAPANARPRLSRAADLVAPISASVFARRGASGRRTPLPPARSS
eukprot:5321191-Lingulodinium_polyedra.AAC.1